MKKSTDRRLSVTQRIMHLASVRQSVTVLQLFDGESGAFIEVMTRLCSGREGLIGGSDGMRCNENELYLMIWHMDSITKKLDLRALAPYTVGTKYMLQLHVKNRRIAFVYQTIEAKPVSYTHVIPCEKGLCGAADSKKLYFKTGAYIQYAKEEEPNGHVLLYQYRAVLDSPGSWGSTLKKWFAH